MWNEQALGGLFQVKLRTFLIRISLSGPESQISTAETETDSIPPGDDPACPMAASLSPGLDKRDAERHPPAGFGLDGTKNCKELCANTTPGPHRVPMALSLTTVTLSSGSVRALWARFIFGSQIFSARADWSAASRYRTSK